jgi:hypothetical protein
MQGPFVWETVANHDILM